MKILFSVLMTVLSAVSVYGQDDPIPTATSCYYISNANVVVRPGDIRPNTSLILRNGLIENVGKDLAIPYDAKTIVVDSMFVYAGFIDAFSTIALQKEKDNEERIKPKSPGAATLEQAGITPQVSSSEKIDYKNKDIADHRNNGFVLAHVFPEGYIMPGKGSLLSLSSSDNLDNMLLMKDQSMAISLKTKRGVFPSTLIGAMSRLRELHKNTGLYLKNQSTYFQNPKGTPRPQFVNEYDAYADVYNRLIPVYFSASKPKDIHRAVTLQKELGFDMVLANVKLASPILDIIPAKVPLILSLDLPKELKEEKEEEDDKKDEKDEKSAEFQALSLRKKESYDLYLSQAKMLSENNRIIAFTTNGIKPSETIKNIRRLIEAGLSEETALAALTTSPAQLLQIENTAGTIETGKAASLVISDKPIFEEKASIKYIFVEGSITEIKEKKENKKKKKEGSLGNIDGAWRFEVSLPNEAQYGNFFIEQKGSTYSIGAEADSSPGEVLEAYDVEINGSELSFSVLDDGDQPVKADVEITFLTEDRFEGTITIAEAGTFPIVGDKRDKPD